MAYVRPILPTGSISSLSTLSQPPFESLADVNRVNEISPATWSIQLGFLLNTIMTALNAMNFSVGLVAQAGTNTKVKTTNTVQYTIGGFAYTKAATDNFWVLDTTCNVTNAYWNGIWLGINAAGTAVFQAGTQATTQAGIVMPMPAATTCVLGYLTINPTGTGNFVGGTTPLNDGTVVPNAAYYDITFPGAFTLLT